MASKGKTRVPRTGKHRLRKPGQRSLAPPTRGTLATAARRYARIFRNFGCDVRMLIRGSAKSALDRIGIDRDVAQKLIDTLYADDVQICEDTSVARFEVRHPEQTAADVVLRGSHLLKRLERQ